MTVLQFILINCNLLLLYGLFELVAYKKGKLGFNRFYLLLVPLLSVAIPFIPSILEPSKATWVVQLSEISILATTSEGLAHIPFPWLQTVYLAGLAVSALLFGMKMRKVLKHPESRRVSNYRGAEVYILESDKSSYSFFNRIYINESQLEAAEVILFHESAHSKGRHSLDMIIMSLYKVIFWFNPLIFVLAKKVRQNHEFIADEFVLKQEVTKREYSEAMLKASFNCEIPSLGNGFNKKSLLRKRIEHLKHKNQYNMKHVLIIPVLAGLFLTSASLTVEPNDPVENEIITQDKGENYTKPEFKGGMSALINFLSKEIKYPKTMEDKGIEGKVIVEFDVDADGSILNVVAKQSSGQTDLDTEAVRATLSMPKWIPGTKDGKPVRVQMQLPIDFKLS